MNRRSFKYACEQIVAEALYLYVFPTDQSRIHQHVRANQQLCDSSGVLSLFDKYKQQGRPDTAEMKK